MRRLMFALAAAVFALLATAGPAVAQEVGPTPYWTFPPVGPTPYYVDGTPVFGGAPTELPQTGTSLALIFGAGVLVMLLGLWAARRRAGS